MLQGGDGLANTSSSSDPTLHCTSASKTVQNSAACTVTSAVHCTSGKTRVNAALSSQDRKSLHRLNLGCSSQVLQVNTPVMGENLLVTFEKDFKSPIIKCSIANKQIYICIDSGCENLLCTQSLAEKIYGNELKDRMVTYCGNVYVDAQNNIMTMTGSIPNVSIFIGHLKIKETMHIYSSRNNQMQALLGFNILKRHQIAIFPEGLKQVSNNCKKLSPKGHPCFPVRSLESVLIPAQETRKLMATIDLSNTGFILPDFYDKMMVCHSEGMEDCDIENLSLYFQYIFPQDNNVFMVMYKNTSNVDIFVEKAQQLGICEEMIEPSNKQISQHQNGNCDFAACYRLLYTDEKSFVTQDINDALSEQEIGPREKINIQDQKFNIQAQDVRHEQYLRKIFQKFPDLAAKHAWDVATLKGSVISFKLKQGSQPVAQRPFTVPIALAPKARKLMSRLQELGLVRPSNSPWSSNVIVLRKKAPEKPTKNQNDIAMQNEDDTGSIKTNQLRFCFDNRVTNNMLLPLTTYPIPSTWQILQKLAGAKWLASVDAANAYWGMKISEHSSKILSFSWFGTQMEPTRCPQGIKYGPVLYQARLHKLIVKHNLVNFGQVSKEGHQSGCQIYQDNILIHSDDLNVYKKLLYQVLKVLSENNFRVKLEKSHFFLNKRAILFGFDIDIENGILTPDRKKIDKIMNIQRPKGKKSLRAMLGACFYFNSLCPRMQHVAAPLTSMTSVNKPFKWSSECDHAFIKLKEILAAMPMVYLYNPNLPIMCYSDACIRCFVAHSCYQWDKKLNKLCPILHWCHKLSPSQQNLSQHACELLSILMFCTKQSHLIYSNRVFLFSDCLSLQYAVRFSPKNQTICRWWSLIKTFDIYIYFLSCTNPTFHLTDLMTRSLNLTPYTNKKITQEDVEKLPILSFYNCPPMTMVEVEKVIKSFHHWYDSHPSAAKAVCTDDWEKAFPVSDIAGIQPDGKIIHFCAQTNQLSLNDIQKIPIQCIYKIKTFEDFKAQLAFYLPQITVAQYIKYQTEDKGIKQLWNRAFGTDKESNHYQVLGGVFCKRNCIGQICTYQAFLPRLLTFQVIQKAHAKCDVLHLGLPKCKAEVDKYFVVKNFRQVFDAVKNKCGFCLYNQGTPVKRQIQKGVQIFLGPRLCIQVDICEFQSKWETGCFITIMCPFTLYVTCHSIKKTATAEDIVLLISECYIKYFGNIRYCIKDNQKSMTSSVIDTALAALKIQPVLICPLNSRSNQGAERLNFQITKMLSFIHQAAPLQEKYLDFYLSYCCLVWNSTPNAVHGQTPSLLNTGFEARVNNFLLTQSFQTAPTVPKLLLHLQTLYEFLFQLMKHRSKLNKTLQKENISNVNNFKVGMFCIIKDNTRGHEGRAGYKLRQRYQPGIYRIWKVGAVNCQLIPWQPAFQKHTRPYGRGSVPKIRMRICKQSDIKVIKDPDYLIKWNQRALAGLAFEMEKIVPVFRVSLLPAEKLPKAQNLHKLLGCIIQSSAFETLPMHQQNCLVKQYTTQNQIKLRNHYLGTSQCFITGNDLITVNSHLSQLKSSSSLNDCDQSYHKRQGTERMKNIHNAKWKRLYDQLHPKHKGVARQPSSSWFPRPSPKLPWWKPYHKDQDHHDCVIDHDDFDDEDFYVHMSSSDIVDQAVNEFDRASEEIRSTSSHHINDNDNNHDSDNDNDHDSDNDNDHNSNNYNIQDSNNDQDSNNENDYDDDSSSQYEEVQSHHSSNGSIIQADEGHHGDNQNDDNDQNDNHNQDNDQHDYHNDAHNFGNDNQTDHHGEGSKERQTTLPEEQQQMSKSSRGRTLRPASRHPLAIYSPTLKTNKSGKTFSVQTGKVGKKLAWNKNSHPATSKQTSQGSSSVSKQTMKRTQHISYPPSPDQILDLSRKSDN